LPGMPLLPPLAGITARISSGLSEDGCSTSEPFVQGWLAGDSDRTAGFQGFAGEANHAQDDIADAGEPQPLPQRPSRGSVGIHTGRGYHGKSQASPDADRLPPLRAATSNS
jgi:hypothetical protein